MILKVIVKNFCQVEALQVQMEEQTRLAKEQIETLLEDRRIKAEEAETRRIRDQEQIRALTDRWVAFQKMALWSLSSKVLEGTDDFINKHF